MQQKLDFTSFSQALKNLQKAIDRSVKEPHDEELRDAVIQRFEYTFELCWRMLKRRLELDVAVPAEIDAMSYQALMRESAERGLIEDVEKWLVYREQRNITAHTYNAAKAKSVYETALEFFHDAKTLLNGLEARNHD